MLTGTARPFPCAFTSNVIPVAGPFTAEIGIAKISDVVGICAAGVGVAVGVGVVVGVTGVADGVTVGAAVAVALAVCVAFVVVVALPAAWLLLVDDVQPAIDNETTITSTIIANSFLIIQSP
jgi:hypothetical protein